MVVEVRQARLADREAIQAFIRSAYGDLARSKGADRWNWQFVNNPFLAKGEDDAPVFIALDGGRVVGQIAVQAAEVQLGRTVHRAGWIVDVMIDPQYRGHGLGHQLHAAAHKSFPILLTLTMAPATRRMAERLGAVTLGQTRQYSLWRRVAGRDVRRFLAQRAPHRHRYTRTAEFLCRYAGVDKILATLAATYLATRNALSGRVAQSSVSVDEVERFGEEIDQFWNSARTGYPAICPRDSRFLNWRFVECPGLHYDLFLARRDGAVVGYSVLRRAEPGELRQGIIVDLFAALGDRDTIDQLIAHAVAFFGDQVASVECGSSSIQIAASLRALGFFATSTHFPTILSSGAAEEEEVKRVRDDWFFSKADHDWDQIHLA